MIDGKTGRFRPLGRGGERDEMVARRWFTVMCDQAAPGELKPQARYNPARGGEEGNECTRRPCASRVVWEKVGKMGPEGARETVDGAAGEAEKRWAGDGLGGAHDRGDEGQGAAKWRRLAVEVLGDVPELEHWPWPEEEGAPAQEGAWYGLWMQTDPQIRSYQQRILEVNSPSSKWQVW